MEEVVSDAEEEIVEDDEELVEEEVVDDSEEEIEELVEDLAERSGNSIDIQLDIAETDIRFDSTIEENIFRIVQQACANVIQHAKAEALEVTGTIDAQQIYITIADDGIGFEITSHIDIDHLLADRHFGIVGMNERANIIGATLHIDSAVGNGTTVSNAIHFAQEIAKDLVNEGVNAVIISST